MAICTETCHAGLTGCRTSAGGGGAFPAQRERTQTLRYPPRRCAARGPGQSSNRRCRCALEDQPLKPGAFARRIETLVVYRHHFRPRGEPLQRPAPFLLGITV